MSGFLTRAASEDSGVEEDTVSLEETYLRLFPKIGRDFLSREDLLYILNQLVSQINEILHSDIKVDSGFDSRARSLAWEYKIALASQSYGLHIRRDLINLDD